MMLFATLQQAHLFTVTLSTGGRGSEIVSLSRNCIERNRTGAVYASGLTFKLVRPHEGEMREWILPAIAAAAIEQQIRLVALVEKIGPQIPDGSGGEGSVPTQERSHLWAQLPGHGKGDRVSPLLNLRPAFARYATTLGMPASPGGQNLRPHRLRKTVARLVALALTQAPKILMSLFGHKSIEMTMYYILTDKDLLAEVGKVSRELRIMRANKVVADMIVEDEVTEAVSSFGGYGGPAAARIQGAIDARKGEMHRSRGTWNANDTLELAEILTLQGQAWQLVRPGVVCTKFPGTESGPCNQRKGRPEPSQCRTSCAHRLEERFLREDVDGAIRDALAAYQKALEDDDELMQALWAGQVRAHLARFEDIRLRWLKNPYTRTLILQIEPGD